MIIMTQEELKVIEEIAKEHAKKDMECNSGYSINPLDDMDWDDDEDC